MTSFLRTRKDRQPRPENPNQQPHAYAPHAEYQHIMDTPQQKQDLNRTIDSTPPPKSYDKPH